MYRHQPKSNSHDIPKLLRWVCNKVKHFTISSNHLL
jgi:hypothetical protein